MSAHHKYVYDVESLEKALGLPVGESITRIWVDGDPLQLSVAVEVDTWYGAYRKSELPIAPRPETLPQ